MTTDVVGLATEKVTFHSLNKRFLEQDEDVPEQAQEVMYYSLAIGHHVGVIDCFKLVFECPLPEYIQWVEYLPEGEARRKMLGLLKFGEIVIDSTHIGLLGEAFIKLKDQHGAPYDEWTLSLLHLLRSMVAEPVMYLMVKRQKI